jgi:hypothetical protein
MNAATIDFATTGLWFCIVALVVVVGLGILPWSERDLGAVKRAWSLLFAWLWTLVRSSVQTSDHDNQEDWHSKPVQPPMVHV